MSNVNISFQNLKEYVSNNNVGGDSAAYLLCNSNQVKENNTIVSKGNVPNEQKMSLFGCKLTHGIPDQNLLAETRNMFLNVFLKELKIDLQDLNETDEKECKFLTTFGMEKCHDGWVFPDSASSQKKTGVMEGRDKQVTEDSDGGNGGGAQSVTIKNINRTIGQIEQFKNSGEYKTIRERKILRERDINQRMKVLTSKNGFLSNVLNEESELFVTLRKTLKLRLDVESVTEDQEKNINKLIMNIIGTGVIRVANADTKLVRRPQGEGNKDALNDEENIINENYEEELELIKPPKDSNKEKIRLNEEEDIESLLKAETMKFAELLSKGVGKNNKNYEGEKTDTVDDKIEKMDGYAKAINVFLGDHMFTLDEGYEDIAMAVFRAADEIKRLNSGQKKYNDEKSASLEESNQLVSDNKKNTLQNIRENSEIQINRSNLLKYMHPKANPIIFFDSYPEREINCRIEDKDFYKIYTKCLQLEKSAKTFLDKLSDVFFNSKEVINAREKTHIVINAKDKFDCLFIAMLYGMISRDINKNNDKNKYEKILEKIELYKNALICNNQDIITEKIIGEEKEEEITIQEKIKVLAKMCLSENTKLISLFFRTPETKRNQFLKIVEKKKLYLYDFWHGIFEALISELNSEKGKKTKFTEFVDEFEKKGITMSGGAAITKFYEVFNDYLNSGIAISNDLVSNQEKKPDNCLFVRDENEKINIESNKQAQFLLIWPDLMDRCETPENATKMFVQIATRKVNELTINQFCPSVEPVKSNSFYVLDKVGDFNRVGPMEIDVMISGDRHCIITSGGDEKETRLSIDLLDDCVHKLCQNQFQEETVSKVFTDLSIRCWFGILCGPKYSAAKDKTKTSYNVAKVPETGRIKVTCKREGTDTSTSTNIVLEYSCEIGLDGSFYPGILQCNRLSLAKKGKK